MKTINDHRLVREAIEALERGKEALHAAAIKCSMLQHEVSSASERLRKIRVRVELGEVGKDQLVGATEAEAVASVALGQWQETYRGREDAVEVLRVRLEEAREVARGEHTGDISKRYREASQGLLVSLAAFEEANGLVGEIEKEAKINRITLPHRKISWVRVGDMQSGLTADHWKRRLRELGY